ncbi:MAG: hypothetical protein J6T51_01145, partial [Kiritimatiellae bacterium]|nr:hypothetical protein [Kiritimatiellia bacterium]
MNPYRHPPSDTTAQHEFVQVKPPPRQSGQTDIVNDEPPRIATASIVTGQQMESSVAETWSTSI